MGIQQKVWRQDSAGSKKLYSQIRDPFDNEGRSLFNGNLDDDVWTYIADSVYMIIEDKVYTDVQRQIREELNDN